MDRSYLEKVSRLLLRLHKTLLDSEMAQYSLQFGTPKSAGERLQLVLSHAQFQWLRMLSQLIAEIDEIAFSKKTFNAEGATAALQKTHELLFTEDGDFQKHIRQLPSAQVGATDLLLELKAVLRS
jgi:hypothetical protein